MVVLKIYFLGGLLLLAAVMVFWREESELAAVALLLALALLALVLGLLQVYVTLPVWLKVALALAYLAGIASLMVGDKEGELAGRLLVLLVLLAHGVGVVRFPGKARSS